MPGKVDWLANNLPVEGDDPEAPIAGRVMRVDAVLCRPTDRVADIRDLIERSPYPFALVTSDDRTLLGRAPSSALDPASDRPVWDVAEPGPKTFRPHVSAGEVAGVLADKGYRWAIVTTPEGRFLGVASREDLEHLDDADRSGLAVEEATDHGTG
ncbi:MAG: CBS domain-containing protein [Solirubrobacterales bacterium]|nr:CBS domain-containing protein [Solirubrobacterales bacterium]